ncbi:MAG: LicD family protein [Syntrophomonadaceae bacterium]|jgi:lipopolysaccharide cholinephosphotransferase
MANNVIKRELLEILQAIDYICTQENISYMLGYGTLLGAVREHDFIDWDDDADLIMHRRDFEAFEKCSLKYLLDMGLFLGSTSIGKANDWQCVSVIPHVGRFDNPDRMVEIMILDTIPANKIKRKIQVFMLLLLHVMFRKNVNYQAYNNLSRRTLMFMISVIGRLTSEEAKLKAFKNVSTLGNQEQSDLLFISTERPQFLDLQIKKSFVENTIRMPFAGAYLLVPAGWDAFLKLFYGDDYMTPKRNDYYVSV